MTQPPPFTIPPALQPYAHQVRVHGIALHLYDAGQGAAPPLVLIHGLGDEADTWQRVLPALATQRRVLALDLPGFGRSDQSRRNYTPAFFAQTVLALLDTLGIAQATLAGNSMGAAVALRLALARPSRVSALALLDGSLLAEGRRLPPPLLALLTPLLGESIYSGLRSSQDAAEATLRPYYFNYDRLPAELRAFLRERVWARVWSDGQMRAYFSALRWLVLDTASRSARFRRRLAQLQVPCQVIWGAHDQVAPLASGQALAALVPNARLHVLPDCGHLPQQEQPAALVALLQS